MKTFNVRVVDQNKLADGESFLDCTFSVKVESNNKKNARLLVAKDYPRSKGFAVGLAAEVRNGFTVAN